MKPVSSLHNKIAYHSDAPRFSVQFDDGITILLHTVNDKLEYENMLSTGLDSVVFKTGWPSDSELEERVAISIKYVLNNIKRKRYKTLKKTEHVTE